MTSITQEIVTQIADIKGVEPTAVDFELYEYIDPAAVERLVTHSDSDARITVTVAGYGVRIFADGSVTVASSVEELM